MNLTGIVRKMHGLGKISIPSKARKKLGIDIGESVEIFQEGEKIILRKYEPACIFCGEARDVINYKGKNICKDCMKELKK